MATIAVSGNGRSLRRHVIGSLEKALSALGCDALDIDDSEVTLLIEISSGMDYDTMSASRHALDWARNSGHPYHLVMDPSVYDGAVSDYLEKAMNEAAEQTRSTNISRLLEAGDILILGWDDQDDTCMRALAGANKRGVMVYDQEFAEIVMGDPDEDEDDDDYPEGPIEVWLSDSIEAEVRAMLAPLADKIAELIERSVRQAVETKTRVRNHK